MRKNSIVIFSGGTGGHVIPAMNYGNFLFTQGYNPILFLDKRGIKYAKNFKGKIIKINSSHFSGNYLFIFNSFFYLLSGLFQSLYHLILIRPKISIGFGSYASFVPLLICVILKFFKITKIYLHEQNSIIGKVNLFFLPFSEKIFSNFENVKNLNIKYKKKFICVGLPNKDEIIYKKRDINMMAKKNINIFVYGGSQGSINLNEIFFNLIKKLPIEISKKISLTMQSSIIDVAAYQNQIKDFVDTFEIKNFFDSIDEILFKTDLVFSRSGAGAINDIVFSQCPAILVPFPHSIYNHQYDNAKYLVDKNAAILIEEKNLNLDIAYNKFIDLLKNENKRITLMINLQSLIRINANKTMFNLIKNELNS
tara:strand:- start:1260 stop:2357 length:1098 start_codon:yes stop_codon:yes gene_type:complete